MSPSCSLMAESARATRRCSARGSAGRCGRRRRVGNARPSRASRSGRGRRRTPLAGAGAVRRGSARGRPPKAPAPAREIGRVTRATCRRGRGPRRWRLVDVGVIDQRAAVGMQHARQARPGAEPLGVGADVQQRRRRGLEQEREAFAGCERMARRSSLGTVNVHRWWRTGRRGPPAGAAIPAHHRRRRPGNAGCRTNAAPIASGRTGGIATAARPAPACGTSSIARMALNWSQGMRSA